MKGFILLFAFIISGFGTVNAQYQAFATGGNTVGQLGLGNQSAKELNLNRLKSSKRWKTISSGVKFSVAIAEDGTLWAWGLNDKSQLGDGSDTNRFEPIRINSEIWLSVSCGATHTIALKNDSTLWAWGDNTYGQLGTGDKISVNIPTQIGTFRWRAIDAGNKHNLAIKNDGTLWAWGDNTFGQLGINNQIESIVPILIPSMPNWAVISAGYDFSVAIMKVPNPGSASSVNSLWAWGKNSMHQLGLEDISSKLAPTRIGSAINWDKVVAGYEYCMATKTDSTLWAWGANSSGQIGNNGGDPSEVVPVQIGTDKWINISTYHEHSLAVKKDGTLWGWGRNTYGQLGQGDSHWNPTVPVQISDLNGWKYVSAGDNMSIMLRESSTIAKPMLKDPSYDYPDAKSLISFRWDAVPTATKYTLQISDDKDFATMFYNAEQTETYFVTNGFKANEDYYWKVQAKNGLETSEWSDVSKFTTEEFTLDQAWGNFSNTGYSATIGLVKGGSFKIDDKELEAGDAIGAFYVDGTISKCAGYMIWDNTKMGFTVWGDDELTANVKEGFANSEKYEFKVFQTSTGLIHSADVAFEYGAYGSDVFQNNGLTKITSIKVSTSSTQTIALDNGWNMVSSYINPNDTTFSNIITLPNSPIKFAKNFEGKVYWPGYLTNLTAWNSLSAYTVKTVDNCNLQIKGKQIMPEENQIRLNGRGWKWIPYYRETSMSPSQALAGINGSYLLVKSLNGKVYWPQNVYSLTNLEPGKGYMVYMNKTATLTYPANNLIYGKMESNEHSNIASEPEYFKPNFINTGSSAVLSLNIAEAQDGDEIGVFTADGQIVGSAVYMDNNVGITIWGDDFLTSEKDGANENEALTIRLYRKNSNSNSTIYPYYIYENTTNSELINLNYKTNAIFTAKANTLTLGVNDVKLEKLSISPMPASDYAIINFENSFATNARLSIYSASGEAVKTLDLLNLNLGMNKINLDLKDLSGGMYNAVISSGVETIITKLIVVK